MVRMGTKTIVPLLLGLLFGIVFSPISLWLLMSNEFSDRLLRVRNSISVDSLNTTESSLLHWSISKALDAEKQLETTDDKLVHIAVLSSSKSLYQLNRATAAYYSYGKNLRNAFQVYTFPTRIGGKRKNHTSRSHIPIKYMKQLENSTESKTHFLNLLDHLCQDGGLNHQFLLLLRDDVYVQVKNVYKFLRSLGPGSEPLYIGLSSNHGYCRVGTGILLRKVAFQKICHSLHQCADVHSQAFDVSEDEIVGVCLQRILGSDCWSPQKVKSLFFFDKGNTLRSSQLYNSDILKDAMTIHPVADLAHFNTIHRYISEIQVKSLIREASLVVEDLNVFEESLPHKSLGSHNWKLWYKRHNGNPKSKHELLVWQYFNTSLYQLHEYLPSLGLLNRHKSSIDTALQVVVNKMKHSTDLFSPPYFLNEGYMVIDESTGLEYIFDMSVKRKSSNNVLNYIAYVLLPFQGPGVSFYHSAKDLAYKTVNMIIPIAHYHNSVTRFLEMYENQCLRVSQQIHLHLVFFYHDEVISKKISQIKDIYQSAQIQTYEITDKPYSSSYAYNYIAEILSDDDLMLFFDLSFQFSVRFLTHCRLNSIKGKQAFSPIGFSLYKPELAKMFTSKMGKESVTSDNGFFLRYNYQVISIYRSDFAKIGGFRRSKGSTGSEDSQLIENILKSDIYLMRALAPFLIRLYQPRNCSALKSKSKQESCVKSVIDSIGSKKALGMYLLHNGMLDTQT